MTPELLTVIVASVSCLAFCLVVLLMVVIFYRKDPLCCRFTPYETEQYTYDRPHYHSRHSLIGITHSEPIGAINQGAVGSQVSERLFIIGKPNDYHLNGPQPRLPSYESVRKKDRQRQIHRMISQRFGLRVVSDEPPPTYEETIRQSVDLTPVHLHSVDVQPSVRTRDDSPHPSEDNPHNPHRPPTALQGTPPSDSGFLSI